MGAARRVVGKTHPTVRPLWRDPCGQASRDDDAADAEDGRPARTRERALSRRHGRRDDEHAHPFKAVQLHQLYIPRAFLSPPTRPSEEEEVFGILVDRS